MKHISFFSGLRGFDLAAEKSGWENISSVEIDESLNRRFKNKYPNARQHTDIRNTDFTPYRGIVDVVSGGFPCQPYSNAGKRKGTDDERHLWPEMLRGIRETQAPWVVAENVRGIVSWSGGMVFEQVCADLEAAGYEVQPFILPAAGVNAPHERQRVWFVAHATSRMQQRNGIGECRGAYGEGVQHQYGQANSKQPSTMGEIGTPTNTNIPEFGIPVQSPKGWQQGGHAVPVDESADATNTQGVGYEQPWNTRAGRDGFANMGKSFANTHISRREQLSPPGLAARPGFNTWSAFDCWDEWILEPPVCRVDDGLPVGMDVARLRSDIARLYPAATQKNIERAIQKTITAYRNEIIKAYGNAVVWQIPYRIFQCINEYEKKS